MKPGKEHELLITLIREIYTDFDTITARRNAEHSEVFSAFYVFCGK